VYADFRERKLRKSRERERERRRTGEVSADSSGESSVKNVSMKQPLPQAVRIAEQLHTERQKSLF
jgi:hypothetical protein